MPLLAPCATCHRHVGLDAPTCPFCHAPPATLPPRTPTTILGRVTRAAVFAGAVGAAGCGASVPKPHYDQMTSPASATGESGEVRGRITRHTGEPAQTTVYLVTDIVGTRSPSTTTDGNGYYRFDDIPAGEYEIRVSGSKHRVRIVVRPAQAVVLDVAQDEPPKVDTRHMAKPYGAPPARRRVV